MKKIFATLFMASVFCGAYCAEIQSPASLVVGENFSNPIGYNLDDLTFSWQLPRGSGAMQSAYRIQVAAAADDFSLSDVDFSRCAVWDSGKVLSDKSVKVPFVRKVEPRERLYWRVKYWDAKGAESAWSDVNFFEAGLSSADWNWTSFIMSSNIPVRKMLTLKIGKENSRTKPKTEVRPTYFRKEFSLGGREVKKARLYITTLGIFQAYINGEKVGDDFWGTGWTDYNKRVQSNTYDVTKMLKRGTNAIGAVLADGWYAGLIGWRHRGVYGDVPMLAMRLEIEYADGSISYLTTNKSWKNSYGAIQSADIYAGEKYDARLEMKGWNTVGFDDSLWGNSRERPINVSGDRRNNPPVVLSIDPRRNPPVRAEREVVPVSVKKIANGSYIFDMGQNMVGWEKLNIPTEENQRLRLRFAEMLNKDGTLYTENYRAASSRDEVVSTGGMLSWSPTFTYHGFRYIEVSGLDPETEPSVDWVRGVVLHTDIPQIADFKCSNPKVNKLQNCIIWGQKSNFFSVPTDCPQRDERLGWTGDACVFTPTAAYNMDVNAFFAKWCVDMLDSRKGAVFAVIAPDILNIANGSPAWTDAGVICPWEIYMAFGDKKILANCYDGMKKWVEYQRDTSKNFIRPETGFGDWLQPSSKRRDGDTPKSLIGTAYFVKTADIVAKAAEVLGKKEDVESFKNIGSAARAAFAARFVKPDGSIESGTQTAYLLPLAFDVLPADISKKTFSKFVERLEKDKFTLDTGFVGTPYLNPVLTKFGRVDLAYKLLLNESYPSWLYPINQGATTMWERWNSFSKEKGFGDADMNSFNHYAYGAIGQWLYKDVGGLWYAEAGYKKILFAPKPDKLMSSASVWRDTPYGRASSDWRVENNVMKWKVEIPSNSSGVVVFRTSDFASIKINGKPLAKEKSKIGVCGYPNTTLPAGVYDISFKL